MARYKIPRSRRDDLQRLHEVALDDPHPGARSEDGTWNGPGQWFTRHGPATLIWSGGRPSHVVDGLLSDGKRVEVQSLSGPKPNWRRPKNAPESFFLCDVEVSRSEIVINDVEHPIPAGPYNAFEKFVAEDEFLSRSIRENFCFCIAFTNLLTHWDLWGKGEIIYNGGDEIAYLSARIRNTGNIIEDIRYSFREDLILEGQDFWPEEGEIRKHINDGGWFEFLDKDYEQHESELQKAIREVLGSPTRTGWTKVDAGWIRTG